MIRLSINNIAFNMIDPSERLPESEERVLAVIFPTGHEEPILQFCHFWDGHWENDRLNLVKVISWLPSPKIIMLKPDQ